MTSYEMALMASIAADMQKNEVNEVLDQMRAEIDAESANSFRCSNFERANALEWVLSIIDKYKAESEDKK